MSNVDSGNEAWRKKAQELDQLVYEYSKRSDQLEKDLDQAQEWGRKYYESYNLLKAKMSEERDKVGEKNVEIQDLLDQLSTANAEYEKQGLELARANAALSSKRGSGIDREEEREKVNRWDRERQRQQLSSEDIRLIGEELENVVKKYGYMFTCRTRGD